jgi:hypothetical protein
MRHSDMPTLPLDEAVAPTPEMDAWQSGHEPTLVLRAWVADDGRVLTRSTWAKDVQGADMLDKPVLDMALVLNTMSERLVEMARQVARVHQVREALEAVVGDN